MLLVLNVVYNNRIAAQVSKDLNRNRAWACVWLKRYDKEGIRGLKDKPKSGRDHPNYQKRQVTRLSKN